MSFRHKRFCEGVEVHSAVMLQVKITRLVHLCPNDDEDLEEEPESADLEGLATDTDEAEEGLGDMDYSWGEEEPHNAEVGLNPADGIPGPADTPEAEDTLIFETMGFSSFGNPNYQRRDNQSEAWTRWTARRYANAEDLNNIETGEELNDIENSLEAIDIKDDAEELKDIETS